MVQYTEWRSISDGSIISSIPDSDLTQYEVTDPDNRITINDSDSYDARLSDGANDVSRVYKNVKLESLTYTFDIVRLSAVSNEGETTVFGWESQEDVVFDDVNAFIGCEIVNDEIRVTQQGNNVTDINTQVTTITENDERQIVLDYDTENTDLTLTVYDGDNNELGSESISYDDSPDHDFHYAHMAFGRSFTIPGELDFDVTNHKFEPL